MQTLFDWFVFSTETFSSLLLTGVVFVLLPCAPLMRGTPMAEVVFGILKAQCEASIRSIDAAYRLDPSSRTKLEPMRRQHVENLRQINLM